MKKKTPKSFLESYAEEAGLLKHGKKIMRHLVFLAGSIENDPEYRAKFDLAEIILKSRGHIVINPLKIPKSGTRTDFIAADLYILTELGVYDEIRRKFSLILPPDTFPSPVVCILDNYGGCSDRVIEVVFAETRGVPHFYIDALLSPEQAERYRREVSKIAQMESDGAKWIS